MVAPSGGCVLRAAPEGTQAAERAALAAEAAELGGLATRLLADAAAMRLAPAREGVPGFGDWAYGWVQSYVTSYRILARAVAGLAQSVTEPEVPLGARLAEEMAAPMREEFRSRVLDPALGDRVIAADLAHVGAALDAAWAAALAASAARLARLPPAPAEARPTHRLDLAAAARAVTPDLAASAPTDPLALIAEEGTEAGTVFVRSMRPLAARLGAVLVRASEAGSFIAAGGAFGFAMAGLPGSAVGIAGGVGTSWAIDWLINRLDASLNRAAFEAQALEAIARAERRLAAGSAAAAATALAARIEALATEGDCR
ncbi:hypothetical protein [Falsiroseomonas sp.]|uniref:hypothetical protein n=1 Tax=Falsiroseomonas sp. TaxID=2870721 RepID=UPI00356AD2A4